MPTLDNAKIADRFDELAELLEFRGENPFRVRAYRAGAHAIRDLDEPVAALLADPTRNLADLPGIGETLAEKARVLVETGTLPQLETLREAIPASVLAMLRIPGLGAKKASRLHQELQIDSLPALRRACEAGQVSKLKGFGAKSEAMILAGLAIAEAAGQRVYWATAKGIADAIAAHMAGCPTIRRMEWAGSLRRGRETVGDLDLLVVAADRELAMDRFEAYPERSQSIARGDDKKVSIRVGNAFQVDLRLVEDDEFGAALQYFTGSKEHNVRLRRLAQSQGLKLNEYGVFRESDGVKIAGATEPEVYRAVGLDWIPPELREDRQDAPWGWTGSRRSCVKIAKSSNGRRRVSCRTWSRWTRSAVTCTCTPPPAMGRRRFARWPTRRSVAGCSTSRSPTIASEFRWPTASTRSGSASSGG